MGQLGTNSGKRGPLPWWVWLVIVLIIIAILITIASNGLAPK